MQRVHLFWSALVLLVLVACPTAEPEPVPPDDDDSVVDDDDLGDDDDVAEGPHLVVYNDTGTDFSEVRLFDYYGGPTFDLCGFVANGASCESWPEPGTRMPVGYFSDGCYAADAYISIYSGEVEVILTEDDWNCR